VILDSTKSEACLARVSDYYENFRIYLFLARLVRISVAPSLGPLISNSKIIYVCKLILVDNIIS